MHPNCRHEFLPFAVELERPEVVERLIKESNHFEEFDKNDKLFKVYNRNQALQRQWVDESREFHKLQDTLGDQMPYKNIGSFRRARRSNSLGYKKLHYHDRDEKRFERWANVENFKNSPKTLDKLQEIKYNNIDEWERLKREKATITEINGKTWTPTFKEKAVNNYYE